MEVVMFRIALILLASAGVPAVASAQSSTGQDVCGSNCPKVAAAATVGESVTVDAVLIPPKIAGHIFGSEISQNYAVVRLTVANHSSDESLVIHGVFLDTTGWLFSKVTVSPLPPASGSSGTDSKAPGNSNTSVQAVQAPGMLENCDESTASFDSGSCPGHVSSVNGDMLRDEVLHQQPFTMRNMIVGIVSDVGTVATAFSPVFSTVVSQGFNGWNGGLVPALNKRWPDQTLAAVNNLASHAYENNKIITKQSSETVVAFFPLQYFLTSSFKKIYLKDPAVFFWPQEALVDRKYQAQLLEMVTGKKAGKSGGTTRDITSAQIQAALQNTCGNDAVCGDLRDLLLGLSLNKLRVVVGGDMTVNAQDVAPVIDTITLKSESDGTAYAPAGFSWLTLNGKAKGVITGKYLKGSTASVTDSSGKVLSGVFTLSNQTSTTDTELDFDLTVAACPAPNAAIAPGANIFFTVSKPASAAGSTSASTVPLVSQPKGYAIVPADVSSCSKPAAAAPANSPAGGTQVTQPSGTAPSGTGVVTTPTPPKPQQ
jgi:hypothetical protein